MTTRGVWPRAAAPLAAGLLAAMAHATAAAQQCDGEQPGECPAGYVCESYSGGGCSMGPCTPEGECPEPVCETREYYTCVAAPCASQADCPDGMTCHTDSYTECEGGMRPPCAPGEDCPEYEPPSCTDYERSTCVPNHALPCTADADCGEGFRCVEERYFVCEGGGAAMPPAGGAQAPTADGQMPQPTAPREEGECHEEASGYFSCQLLELPCDADADCPGSLTCQDQPSSWQCSGSAGMGAAGSPAMPPAGSSTMPPAEPPTTTPDAPSVAGGEAGEDYEDAGDERDFDCAEIPADPPRACAPAGYGYGNGPGRPVPGSGTGNSGSDSGSDDGGEQSPTGDPGGGYGNPTAGEADGGEGSEEGRDRHSRRRALGKLLRHLCSVGAPGAGNDGTLAWLAPLALAGLWLHRRRR